MNILLVDDHAVVRRGYAALLSMMLPDVKVLEAESARGALSELGRHPIDVVILDINMNPVGGLSLAPRILSRWQGTRIIFFSMFEEASVVSRAMQTGASGYISKRCEPEIMVEAVDAVAAGRTYIQHELAMNLAACAYSDANDAFEELTGREFEVFMGVANGQNRTSIALDLSISEKTVSNVITQLKNKLHIKTNAELVRMAIDRGYLRIAS